MSMSIWDSLLNTASWDEPKLVRVLFFADRMNFFISKFRNSKHRNGARTDCEYIEHVKRACVLRYHLNGERIKPPDEY